VKDVRDSECDPNWPIPGVNPVTEMRVSVPIGWNDDKLTWQNYNVANSEWDLDVFEVRPN
jgi:hypothetical protein